jgi:hypothetical protein
MAEHIATTDELFRIVMIDRKRKVRLTIQLRDADGDEVPVRETIEKLTEYVGDKLQGDEDNVCRQQIYPLMGQAVVAGMTKLMGMNAAAYMLSQEHTRYGLINMMVISFYLLKWIQQKNIKIHTLEEPVTDEEIEMYDRVSHANDMTVQFGSMGGNPKKLVRELLRRGHLKPSDLAVMGAEGWLEEEDETEGQSPAEEDEEKN